MRALYRPRWPLLLALIAGVGGLVALTYLPAAPSGELRATAGGAYVEGVSGSPSVVNPLFATFNQVDSDLSSLIFSGLMRLGPNGGVLPDLAETQKITPDGLNYIFELRPGLVWHDGEPLDAEDVLFTIRTIQAEGFQGDPALADLFRDVKAEASNDRTIVITLSQPFAPFLARGATVGILPEHLLGELDAAEISDAPFNKQPVGSGPFRLVALAATRAVLEPSATYYAGRPFLQSLELRFYSDDAELLNALLSEQVDGALFRPGLDAEEIAVIDGNDQWVRRTLHTTRSSLVYLNPQVAVFEDTLVRRALQLAIDRQALIDEILAGQALPLDSPIARDLWAYVGSPEAYALDRDRAALLLDAAGWEMSGTGRAKDGVPLRFTLAASDDPGQVRVAQEIAKQWGELGADVQVEVSGASQFVEGVLLPRAFEAALVSVEPGPDPDPYPLWHSTQALGEGHNLAGFSDPEVDQLLENGRLTTSVAQRAEDYRSFQEIFARQAPAVLLYTPTYQYVVRSDLQGLTPGLLLNLSSRFADANRWYSETGPQDDEQR